MSKKRKPPLFYRSFHLTLGGILLILPVLIWMTQGGQSASWPTFAWILFFCLPVIGIGLLLFGIIASDERIDSFHIIATPNSLLLAVLAVPLYLVLSGIQRNRRERASGRKMK